MRSKRLVAPIALARAVLLAGALVSGCSSSRTLTTAPLAGSACGTGGVNIVRNGGFEEPSALGVPYILYFAGDTIGAWSLVAGAADLVPFTFWLPAEQKQSLDLDGSCGQGTIRQTLAADSGRTYELCFSSAGNYGGPPVVKGLEVWWGDLRVDSLSIDTSGASAHRMGWRDHHYNVSAPSRSVVLEFRSLTPGCYGPVVDDVRVQAIAPPNP